MKKLLFILLIAGAGYYFFTHREVWNKYAPPVLAAATPTPSPTPGFTLKGPFAWKVISRTGLSGPYNITVEFIDGDRWRIEDKLQGYSRIGVAVCDGSSTVAKPPLSPPSAADPRPRANKVFSLAAQTSLMAQHSLSQRTEMRDGHACWKFSAAFEGSAVQFWADAHTGFPVCYDGIINGTHTESHFSPVPVDVAQRAAEIFDTSHMDPLFSYYLTP